MNKPAADDEVPLGSVVVLLKIMTVMDALSVEVPLPRHKLDTARSIGPWNVSEKRTKETLLQIPKILQKIQMSSDETDGKALDGRNGVAGPDV